MDCRTVVLSPYMINFASLVGLAVGVSLLWLALETNGLTRSRRGGDPVGMLDQSVGVLAMALVGGRVGYAAAHADYFAAHPFEMVQIWLGGLSGAGALLGGLAGVLLVAAVARVSPLRLGDRLARLSALVTIAAWLGCWQAGTAYGLVTNGWWAVPAVDEWGQVATRLPIQLTGAVLAMLGMIFLDWQLQSEGSQPAGMRSAAWLIGTGIMIAVLSLGRGDPSAAWNGLRTDTWGGLGVALVGLVWLGLSLIFRPTAGEAD